MATPRVFISSTCYDLKYIRENLKYFVKTIGYEPVMSDNGDVYYNPNIHTHDSCLKEVETCQLFILIIGGRYGGTFKDNDTSITNNEYKHAIINNIPIFTLVEDPVYSDHNIYTTNKKTNPDIVEQINYPSIDNQKIFHFIDEVRKNTQNNAIYAFKDFSDMEIYLKKQWAGMMYDFIIDRHQKKTLTITNNLLNNLSVATKKSEELMKVLLKLTTPDRADKTIEDISNKVEAENFIKLLLDKFKIKNFKDLVLEDLYKVPLPKTWFEFLELTNCFYTSAEGFGDEMDEVIWPKQGGSGLAIGEYIDGELMYLSNETMQKEYESLKKLDKSVQKEVLSILVEGI